MSITDFSGGVSSMGIPLFGSGMPAIIRGPAERMHPRLYMFVDGEYGSDGFAGGSADSPYKTIQKAIDGRDYGWAIAIAPKRGGYDENIVISRKRAGTDDDSGGPLYIVGVGPRGSVYINGTFENREDDVCLINVGIGAPTGAAHALRNFGARFRAYGCKIEGADTSGASLLLGPGTIAQIDTAFSHGDAGDTLFYDCEFCWAYDAVRLQASDYGAVTQARFEFCRFHNYTNSAFEEAGGSASVRYRNLEIVRCTFGKREDGTNPTKFLSLNDDNGNTGYVTQCSFPVAINSGLNLVSTGLLWVANYHTGGISTGQPS